jgi:hypothetical protein
VKVNLWVIVEAFLEKNYILVIKLISCWKLNLCVVMENLFEFFFAFCSFSLDVSCCTIATFKRQHICKNYI